MKYRKKPIEIEAFQWGTDPMPDWFTTKIKTGEIALNGACAYIATLEGIMCASPGDFVIKGVQGELYPCKSDVFEKTHEILK